MTATLARTWRNSHRKDDASIVNGLLRGDENVFLRLVQREHASMVRFARLFVSTPASEEVVREAWVSMLAGLARFEASRSLRSWLFGIVAACAKSRGARSVFRPAQAGDDAEDGVDPDRFFPSGSPQAGRWMRPPERWPEDGLERAETVNLVRKAIERLPGLQREVILLRDVEGWSAEEVCELLGITERDQRALLHRARACIRAGLERHFIGEASRRFPDRTADLQRLLVDMQRTPD